MASTDAARQALATRKENAGEGGTLLQLLERSKPQIERALPQAIGADRFARLVLTEIRRNPALLECVPESVLGAMMLSAQLGLEPGPLGHAYLVPFKRECTFILGYTGMIELAMRSGRLRSIVARVVYEGDEFDYAYGITDRLRHLPAPPSERSAVRLYYGLARFAAPSGSFLHVMHPEEIDAARMCSQLGRIDKGPWHTDREAMALKTVIRRMRPFLPLTAQFSRGLEVDEGIVSGFTDAGADVVDAETSEATEGMES